jgi:glutathione S-transferase
VHKLTLISFDICPFVERTRIVLHEKGLPFEQTVIDLRNKPAWFLEISPRGKVPVMLYDGQAIFESTVINEFLEELAPTPAMLPLDIVERARARAWIAFNNEVMLPALSKLWFGPRAEDAVAGARREVREAFGRVEEHLAKSAKGPYFTGADFGLVDASFAPNFSRFEASAALGFGDLLADFPNLAGYAERVLARPSVQAARAEGLTEHLLEFIRGLTKPL